MNVKFDVKMTKNAMFDFMLYTSYTSLGGILGVVLGGLTLLIGIRQVMADNLSGAAMFFVVSLVFLVFTPLNMKAKAGLQVANTPMFQKPITYELTEDGVIISQEDASATVKWDEIQKAVSTNKSVILYVTKIRAFIFPKESLGEQYSVAVKMISTHVPPKKVKIRHVSA